MNTQIGPLRSISFLQINELFKPLDDMRVRKAISSGLDKEGNAIAANASCLPGGYLFPGGGFDLSKDELGQYAGYSGEHAANVQKAKALLAEAGFPNGFKANFIVRVDPTSTVPMRSNLKDIGIAADIKTMELGPYNVKVGRSGDTDWALSGQGQTVNTGDPNDGLVAYHVSWGLRNSTGVTDKSVDDAYYKENSAQDPAERKKIVQDLERYLLGQYRYVVINWTSGNLSTWAFLKNGWLTLSIPQNFRDLWMEK